MSLSWSLGVDGIGRYVSEDYWRTTTNANRTARVGAVDFTAALEPGKRSLDSRVAALEVEVIEVKPILLSSVVVLANQFVIVNSHG